MKRLLSGRLLVTTTFASYSVAVVLATIQDSLGPSVWLRIPMFVGAGIAGIGVALLVCQGIRSSFEEKR